MRHILSVCLALLLGFSVVTGVRSQEQAAGSLPVIGILSIGSSGSNYDSEAFLAGLRDFGYVDGKNVVIERRSAGGKQVRLDALASDLVSRKVSVIVALQPPAARAAIAATQTIPIVIRSSGDPVKAGFVGSLAKPNGNVTGVTSFTGNLYSKRLELMKELVPNASLIAVLYKANSKSSIGYLKEMKTGAAKLGVKLLLLKVKSADDLPGAFASARAANADGIIPLRNPLIVGNRQKIALLAAEYHLPAVYDERHYVEVGGLLSYGADLKALHRRAAYYVDRILHGASVAELPIEGPKKFEMVLNMKAARAIALEVPKPLVSIADEIIE